MAILGKKKKKDEHMYEMVRDVHYMLKSLFETDDDESVKSNNSMEYVSTDKAPAAIGPYSQAIKCGGMVYTSGQIAIDPATGKIEEGGIQEQTHRVCRNVAALLDAAGTDMTKVVKTVCFIADMADFAAFNEVYAQYFVSKPARSCVAVKTLPKNVLVEIDTVTQL